MKTPALAVLAALLLLSPISPVLHAQAAPTQAGSTKSASVEDRRRALNGIFHEYWEAELKHAPEFASSIGDKRYNDKLTDYSVRAINDWLASRAGLSFCNSRQSIPQASPTRKRSAAKS